MWSDSTTVISWIRYFKLKHKMYIRNRFAEIRDITSTNQWNHVNTNDNPADQGTRGLTATEMTEKSLWLQGPQFLLSSSDNWTTDERQREKVFMNSAEINLQETWRQTIDKDLIDANKFNQWLKQLSSKWQIYEKNENMWPKEHGCKELFSPSIPTTIVRWGC